eukprot:CAMPEP_0113670904 /NCGR_PEP_ID=MMETSP0038_2-20120614/5405_1 /TAXON_ID=2898 /ORGANISM="Cryptomonas paramecium" /LENGTH=476 /DNA_ID=CAMNT_0000586991 /DNA_START=293 /DNA_END=1720 /DNA_ORIENTATION=- /assembly_acc=CAM_ASM_000170
MRYASVAPKNAPFLDLLLGKDFLPKYPTTRFSHDTEDSQEDLEKLIAKAQSYDPNADTNFISKAYYFAEKMHAGQFRKSGEPYLVHPLGVASIIADMRLDTACIVTGLLHDTVEDTNTSLEQIDTEFGSEVAQLVDGVTKIGRIQFTSKQERQAENFRKMIKAMARDIRVILVKLADRMHNVRTLGFVSARKQKEVARETLEIYAPLAHRLGIFWVKNELEDSSLRYLEPDIYEQLAQSMAKKTAEQRGFMVDVVRELRRGLQDAGVAGAEVAAQARSVCSVYQTLQARGVGFDQLRDFMAFLVLVDDVAQCYQVLGVVHAVWKPVPGRFKDYIALPKPNKYQSLHSTVIGPGGQRVEVQIRTREMHKVAEEGIAAHWTYKGGGSGVAEAQRFHWLRQLVEAVQQVKDPGEFMHSVREDLFELEVYAFSPRGDLYALPKGACVVDFAYRVHTEVGNKCSGARVNGRMVPIKYEISS